MRFSLTTLSFAALASLANGATSSNPDNPVGQVLYINSPACGFYQCIVSWHKGETVAVNWIGPTPGNVSVALASNIGNPTYEIVNTYPSISQAGYCDAGSGVGVVVPGVPCGMVEFVVPAGWKEAGNYTIMVSSLTDPSKVGYTDAITILPSNTTSPGPDGTAVSLLTIPAPTSTNLAASTVYDGSVKVPAPTAVVGNAVAGTTSAAAAAGAAGAASKASSGAAGAASSSSTSSGASASSSAPKTAGATAVRKAGGAMAVVAGVAALLL